jgi:hypothetical protein
VTAEFSKDYAAEQIRRSRHPFRRLIKGFYIRNILQDVFGPSIDFACGAGQLLARLPSGSVGVEVNPFLIEELTGMGLNVIHYDTENDRFSLKEFPVDHYSTFIMAHVLEHFTDAAQVLRTLLGSCRRIGIQCIIIVLPGWKGYMSDHTHKTFVDSHYLQVHGLLCCEGYRLRKLRYFPVNNEYLGIKFIFH